MHQQPFWLRHVPTALFVCLGVIFAARAEPVATQSRGVDEVSSKNAAQQSPDNELRGLLKRKHDLLRASIAALKRQAELGLETSSLSDAASLMKECVLVELELCQTREERLRVCTRNLKEMDDVLTKATALHRAGLMPRSELMKLSIYQLDARILLIREQKKADAR